MFITLPASKNKHVSLKNQTIHSQLKTVFHLYSLARIRSLQLQR